MCGIIAVVRRRPSRPAPAPTSIRQLVERALAGLDAVGVEPAPGPLGEVADALEAADALLRGVPGVQALLAAPDLVAELDAAADRVTRTVAAVEAALDAGPDGLDASEVERTNAALVRVKDAAWAIQRDRLRTARLVGELAGPGPGAVEAFTSVQVALSSLDRLEVRGRDSAGLHLLVRGHGLDLANAGIRAMVDDRARDPLFRSGAVRVAGDQLGFVYKAAAEIGELGDNTAALRAAIADDDLLHLALQSPHAEVIVVGHTRWASVGIISQANAHPLDSGEDGGADLPYVVGALNGDVDNHADLKASHGLRVAPEITTDAKVIPTLVARRLADGADPVEAFRSTVAAFEGSVAIAAHAADDADRLLLALRGSGQALYVGLAEDCYVVASEPYGLVEETPRYVRMDGETPADPANPTASRGQVLVLDRRRAGELDGIERIAYDATPVPVGEADIVTAQITTRDIDRGDHAHFLLKEIGEAPSSFRTTLRGKLVDTDDGPAVVLADEALPADVRRRLADGSIQQVLAIGQGTAAVAAQSFAAFLADLVRTSPVRVEALPATELSGFALRPDMADTLVVAISQSGTTTDTNRTVDLARGRGAAVVAVVNRRNSDLTDKADGVLYTSDGRDVEMAVPSTKAFYAQVAAGCLLAVALADAMDVPAPPDRGAVLDALRSLPDAMAAVLGQRAHIARIAAELAPPRRYWAVVGNGPNRIAALELRIKLSELAYRSIAVDVTEDKKHIDLSAEPLILVCAAGLSGSTADDVAKEVAIYRAHKAAPVVIATEGEHRFGAALQAVTVPATHPRLAFVLSAMAGHLFGYEAALAIDAQARPLREARGAIEAAMEEGFDSRDGEALLRRLRPALAAPANRFFDGLRAGSYDGNLEASTASRLSSLLRYALGTVPLDAYQAEHGKVGTPAVVVDDLTAALTRAIEELTRPIDAIKHQAKTVTVGISRTDETLLQVPLVQSLVEAGAPRDALSYRTLRTLADLDPAVAEVTGWIRYRVEGSVEGTEVSAAVVDRGGVAAGIPSRTERSGVLRGTKHTVALEQQVFVTRGRQDGRTIVIVPEVKDGETTGITLLHVRFHDRLPAGSARGVLQGYRGRYAALRDAVTETEGAFREDLLAEQPVVDLLVLPIHSLADRWRA